MLFYESTLSELPYKPISINVTHTDPHTHTHAHAHANVNAHVCPLSEIFPPPKEALVGCRDVGYESSWSYHRGH